MSQMTAEERHLKEVAQRHGLRAWRGGDDHEPVALAKDG